MNKDKDKVSDRSTVLIVDDELVFGQRLCRAFRERDWECHHAANGQQALDVVAGISPDLVLLDLRMPDVSGLDLIEAIKRIDSTISIIILTG
jgi:two-component system response regulator RegA